MAPRLRLRACSRPGLLVGFRPTGSEGLYARGQGLNDVEEGESGRDHKCQQLPFHPLVTQLQGNDEWLFSSGRDPGRADHPKACASQ